MTDESTDNIMRVLIVEAGDYPEKLMTLPPEALRDIADKFKGPLDIKLDFLDGPLGGKLGQLISVETSDDGTKLYGNVSVPDWLPYHPGEYAPAFDRASKALVGLSIVKKGRNIGIHHED